MRWWGVPTGSTSSRPWTIGKPMAWICPRWCARCRPGACPGPLRAHQARPVDETLDTEILARAAPALAHQQPVVMDVVLRNVHRAVGTRLSSEIALRHGEQRFARRHHHPALPGNGRAELLRLRRPGADRRDPRRCQRLFRQGALGGQADHPPPPEAAFAAEHNTIIGNVALYGATSGQAYIRGLAGIRFCVRNSGVHAVVEGTGDHACEYMTGGRVVILGPTGRNTAAGMSGGIAYVLDETGDFGRHPLQPGDGGSRTADAPPTTSPNSRPGPSIGNTQSPVARRLLDDWETALTRFVKIMPTDYKNRCIMSA
jgi:glutamate synthase (NADPH) large chain